MSSLVKNQIAKQLARFTKNFSPNKISVKFLKGEGELHNLELDEKILSDLLELPPWLRITKAVCNKISAKIHWTKLKTDPICLYLDCVEIDMEEVILTQAKQSSSAPPRPPPPQIKEKPANRYGFVEKVVDGMFVQMNSVVVSFKSMEFQASVQMSRLIVHSTTPDWKPDDLRNTRLKDEGKGEVLTFKDIHWSTLRIDANAITKEKSKQKSSSPIRLITSHSSLHMTIKKKLEDCSVVSACLELLLDDILWVLTQSQLQALVGFMDSINKAVGQVSTKKEPVADGTPEGPQHQTYSSSNLQSGTQNDMSGSEFSKYDLLETSYHLRTGRIDLHLCDDNDNDQTDDAHNLAGGAMQVHINKLAIDNYPYHLAGTSRTKWACHNEASLTRAYWVNQLLNTFRNNIKSRKVPGEGMSPRPTRSKTEGISSVNGASHPPASPSRHSTPPTTPTTPHRATPTSPQHQRIGQPQSQRRPVFMYENCYLFRCEEFTIMPVTTNNAPDGGLPFLSSDKKALYLPTDMPAFQVDYTQYYYPTGVYSPVPCPNLFVQLNPVQLTLDITTCIWFNRFLRSIFNSAEATCGLQTQQPTNPSHVDIRIEALMPKIILPCPSDPCCHYRESRPQALQIQMSQVALTNSRVGSNSSQTELLMLLQQFSSSKLYTDLNVFPNDANDVRPLSNLAWLKDFGVVEDPIRIERLLNGLHTEPTGHCRPSQVWCMTADQCWADFLGMTSNKNRPMPFVEALPLRLWFCTPLPSDTPETNQPISARHVSRVDARKDSLDSLKSPQSSSAASSPGCQRAHSKSQHLSTSHAMNSSTNLKHGTAGTNTVISPLDIFQSNECTTKRLGSSLPDSSSLPVSPRSRGFEPLTESKRGLLESDGLMSSPFSSQTSQISSSSSQEDAGDPLNATLATVNTNLAGLNYTSNGDVDHAKTVDASKGPEGDKSLRVPNRAPGSPELLSNGGSKRRSDTSPTGIRKDFGSYSSTDEENLSDYPGTSAKVADMSVLAIIPANFVAQFDHFQFLFLLRLQELLVKMQEDLAAERLKYLDDSDSTSGISSASVSFSVLAKRGEVSIVLPPSPDPWSRGTSSASSYLDPGFVSDGDTGPQDVANDNLDSQGKPSATRTDADEQYVSPLNLPVKSPRADLLLVSDITSASGVDLTGRGSASSMCESTDAWLPQDGEKGMSKPRRGSDASCASSQLGTSVESSARSSARSVRSGRLVSIFTAEGNDIHLGIQMEGDDATVKLTVQDLKVDEKGNLNFEKFLNQKSFKSPLDSSTTVPHPLPTSAPMVNVRAEFGPGAERNTPSAGERGFAHVQLNNIALSLLMSNIESLSECFEDEIILPKMPFYLELKTSNVCIRDDKPPRLLSVPPSLPLNVNLENISVFRNHDAAITIRALNPTPDLRGTYGCTTEDGVPFRGEFPRSVSRPLSRTTSDLSLAGSVSSKSDNDSERECMKAQLSVSRAALLAVQDERQALLKTIERLQYELSMSNREQDRLQSKVISYQSAGYSQKRKTHQ